MEVRSLLSCYLIVIQLLPVSCGSGGDLSEQHVSHISQTLTSLRKNTPDDVIRTFLAKVKISQAASTQITFKANVYMYRWTMLHFILLSRELLTYCSEKLKGNAPTSSRSSSPELSSAISCFTHQPSCWMTQLFIVCAGQLGNISPHRFYCRVRICFGHCIQFISQQVLNRESTCRVLKLLSHPSQWKLSSLQLFV